MNHKLDIDIAFGDCDPAQIVYYPNFYRWFDSTYHSFLVGRGLGHKMLSQKLDCLGTGLIDSGAQFRATATAGDRLTMTMTFESWSEKTMRLTYVGTVNERLTVEGFEVRGLFKFIDGKLRAAPIAPFRELLD